MNQAQALFQFQLLDQDISQRKVRLAEIEQLLGEDTRVLVAEQAVKQAEADLTPWRTRAQDLDLDIKTVTSKAETVDQRLYSGQVTNPKELQDMQDEIASLKRRRSKLEDEMLEAMIEVEAGQQKLAEARTGLENTVAQWQDAQQDLIRKRDILTEELARLREQRTATKSDVEPQNLDLYKRMYRSKQGQVVSQLKDATCQYCGVGQTTQTVQKVRQARDLVTCENCGRILVVL